MDEEWKNKVKGMLKAELARKGVKQTDLARLLEDKYGLKETPQTLSNKIGRGAFSAVFMFQILEAIECEALQLPKA